MSAKLMTGGLPMMRALVSARDRASAMVLSWPWTCWIVELNWVI